MQSQEIELFGSGAVPSRESSPQAIQKKTSPLASNRARGNAFEKRIQEYLESIGYAVERARAKIIWIPGGIVNGKKQLRPISTSHDHFGCCDLIGIHPDRPFTIFIQTTLGSLTGRKEKMQNFKWNLSAQRVQVWTRIESMQSGIRVLELCPNGEWLETIFRLKDGVRCPDNVA